MEKQRRYLSSNGKSVNQPDVGSLLLHHLASSPSPLKIGSGANTTDDTPKLSNGRVGTAAKSAELAPLHLNPTSTSSALILILHLLWLVQWNSRRSPSAVNYKSIAQKREYHKLLLAILSHPKKKSHRTGVHNSLSPTAEDRSSANAATLATATSARVVNDRDPQQDIQWQARQWMLWAYESGFAQLLYNSHIIWSCRSLEALYVVYQGQSVDNPPKVLAAVPSAADCQQEPHQYARVLFALAGISLVLDLRFSFYLLRISRKLDGYDLPITTPMFNSSNNRDTTSNRMQQMILRRPIGTVTALACGLVVVFRHYFEYIPLQVIPFVDNRLLLLGFSMPAGLTSWFCWGILGFLSYPGYFQNVMTGLASGSLWAFGLTNFLQEQYWGNSIIAVFLLLCCLSVRASIPSNNMDADEHSFTTTHSSATRTCIPCVDFVSPTYSGRRDPTDWDCGTTTTSARSNISREDESRDDDASNGYSHSSSQDTLDLESEDAGSIDLELAPLLDADRRQTVRARRGTGIS